MKKKLNCWEYSRCRREHRHQDSVFEEVGTCPASTEQCTDGINGGNNAGRACWIIAGTFCSDEAQCLKAEKLKSCLECDFYHLVREEEGSRFVTGSELAEIVQYKEEILQYKSIKENKKNMKLKKSDLIERLVAEMDDFGEEANNKNKTTIARETVNLVFDSIKETLAAGDRVEIRGFGSFNVKSYEGYVGRNPKTGAKVEVKPKRLPVFRPGRELKEIVDGK